MILRQNFVCFSVLTHIDLFWVEKGDSFVDFGFDDFDAVLAEIGAVHIDKFLNVGCALLFNCTKRLEYKQNR